MMIVAEQRIFYLIKFFKEESHADQFMAGNLYLNTLSYFKNVESEDCDGRMDSTEAVGMWLQPDEIRIKLTVPGVGEVVITKADLAAPVSLAFNHYNNLHVLCLYAFYMTGFDYLDGKINCEPEEVEELQRQLKIDEKCLKFGKIAVITHAGPFLNQLREALKSQQHEFRAKLINYYDEVTFHGEIPPDEVPFWKQKSFIYQREFRLCVYPRTEQEAEITEPITINIGDISGNSAKMDSAQVIQTIQIQKVL